MPVIIRYGKIKGLDTIFKDAPEVVLQGIADVIPGLMAQSDTVVRVDTGLTRDSFDADIQGDTLDVTNTAQKH